MSCHHNTPYGFHTHLPLRMGSDQGFVLKSTSLELSQKAKTQNLPQHFMTFSVNFSERLERPLR